MINDIIKLVLQLLIIGVAGGAVTFYYTRLQKNRELVFNLINQTSTIHTDFLALRYKYNVLFIDTGKPIKNILQTVDIDKIKWKYYEDACLLLSKFQSLKPLFDIYIPSNNDEVSKIDGHYQTFRRAIRSNEPIFQTENGKTSDGLKELKKLNYIVVRKLVDNT